MKEEPGEAQVLTKKKEKDNDYENNVERIQEGHEGIHCKLSECNVNLWRSYLQKSWLCLRIIT